MVLRYIGYGTTDSNGIAKLDHDAEGNVIEGYTGTGEGDIVFVASTDSNPSSSSILSNRVDVYDSPLQKSVLLTVSNNPVLVGTSVTLTATVTEDEEAIVGETVSFKVGSTVIGTSETDSNGVATYTYTTTVGGNLSVSAVWDNVTSNIVHLTVTKKNTLLSISVPQLVYTDVFDVTGVLTDANNVGIEGASVKLYINHNGATSLQATGTTDSNGEITFHNDKVTSITLYQFWLEFEGNDTYADSMSSKEFVTPDAETSVLTVTSPINNSTYYADAPVVVAGTLLTNDGEPITNQVVTVHNGYVRTDSNGAFSTTLNDDMLDELPIGENTISIQFGGVIEYTQSTTSRKITLVQPDLTSDKDILSFADSDSATITATFGKSGQSVTLYDASDDSVVGSMVDEGDGVYSYDYASTGVGDVTFYAKYGDFTRSFLTKTFDVEDCVRYDSNTYLTTTGSAMQIPLDYNLPSTFKVEYDYKPTTASVTSSVLSIGETSTKALLFGRIGGNDSTYQVWARNGSSDLKTTGSSIVASSDFKHLFITYDGTSVNFNDDITVTNFNGVALSKIVQVSGFHQSNDGQIKNIKIKPL